MRVDFEGLQWFGFARAELIKKGLGQDQVLEVLRHIQTGAAMIASGRVSSQDQELVRATRALRHDILDTGEELFEGAVGALVTSVFGMSAPELLSVRVDTIVKRAAIEAGHGLEVRGVWCDRESELIVEDREDDERERSVLDEAKESVWEMVSDEGHAHGEVVCLTNQNIVELRDRLEAEVGLARSSASRIITSAVTAARVMARVEQTEEGVVTAAARVRKLDKTLSISKCAVVGAALADRALERLGAGDTRFADLDDVQQAVLAVAVPFARSVRDVLDLLALDEAAQLQVVKVLGNSARAWLANVSKGKDKAQPSLRAALDVVAVAVPAPVVVVPVVEVSREPLATETQMSLALEVEEAVAAEVVMAAAVPAEGKKPCGVRAARRARARGRRRCLMTLDLFVQDPADPAAAPGDEGQEGGGLVEARRVIESVRVPRVGRPRVVCGGEVGAEEGVVV